jgi:predicted dehydrogenase
VINKESNMSLGVAIIGCGLIGQKRAKALASAKLLACADKVKERADVLALAVLGAMSYENWQEAISHPGVDIVIISTLHDSLAEITEYALKHGCHVLVEKPAARCVSEIEHLPKLATEKKLLIRVGFNHRYHRALLKAKELIDAGSIGELMFLRARYGHGGRVGYDREWRSNKHLSGGGELIDQGPHLIDLSRYFLGDFESIQGFAHTYYWDMAVDDNAFLLLKTKDQKTAFLHVSCSEWKNTFSFEIYGRNGKIDISGLGGSYGLEKITHYKMLKEMGPPETYAWEYPMQDNSWEVEFREFLEDIESGRQPRAGINDAIEALKIIEHIYEVSNK